MTIRPINAADYGLISPMLRDLHAIHVNYRPDLFGDAEEGLPFAEFQSHLDGDNDCSVVAEGERGALLGVCLAEWRDSPSDDPRWKGRKLVYVKALYVPPEHRRGGVGRALMERVGCRAKELGADCVELQVICMEENAFAFYRSMGYLPKSCSMTYYFNEKEEKYNDII